MAEIEPEKLLQISIDTLGQPERQTRDTNAEGSFPLPDLNLRRPRIQRLEYGLSGDIGKHILRQIYLKMYINVYSTAYAEAKYLNIPDEYIRLALLAKFRSYHGRFNICVATLLGISPYTNEDTNLFMANEFAELSPSKLQEWFLASYFDQSEIIIFVQALQQKMTDFQEKKRNKVLALAFYDQLVYAESRGIVLTNEAKEKDMSIQNGFEWLALIERNIDSNEPLEDHFTDNIGIHITLAEKPFARTLKEDGFTKTFQDMMHITDQGYQVTERTWYTIKGIPIVAIFKNELDLFKSSAAAAAPPVVYQQTEAGKRFVNVIAAKASAKAKALEPQSVGNRFKKVLAAKATNVIKQGGTRKHKKKIRRQTKKRYYSRI